MKPKTINELLSDAEATYQTLALSKQNASQRIKKSNSDMYSKEYRQNQAAAARNDYNDARSAAIIRLSKIQSLIRSAAENEEPSLHASSLSPNLMALLTIKGLTAKDFSDLARRNINNHTNIRAIEGEAKDRGFVLRAYHHAEEIAEAAETYIGRLIQSVKDDSHIESELPPIDGVLLSSSKSYADRMCEPFSIDEVRCFKKNLESEITTEIIAERMKAVTPESDNQFEQGFTGKTSKPVDYSVFPAIHAVSDLLDEIKMPEKRSRILDGIFATVDNKRLRDEKPLSAAELKTAADAAMKTNEALGYELKEFADLFLEDGLQFAAKPGLETTKPTAGYDSKRRWETLIKDANEISNREAEAKSHGIVSNTVSTNANNRQARREEAERQRYESVNAVDRTDANAEP